MFKQVTLFGSDHTGRPGAPSSVPAVQRTELHEKFQAALIEWHDGKALKLDLNKYFVPLAVSMDTEQLRELEAIQVVLNKAVVHVVENWWTDKEASYPERMPIEQHQEELLRWISNYSESHMPSYHERRDVQRPDYLIQKSDGANGKIGQVKICEINGRFPYNAFFLNAMIQHATKKVFPGAVKAKFALNEQTVIDSLIGLWDTSKPLHVIEDGFNNVDVYIFARKYTEITGQKVTFIAPADILLAPDASSETGKALFCRVSSSERDDAEAESHLERIHQCSIEPHTPEQAHYDAETFRHLARISVNDLRTSFIANDKRIIGILYEELDSLAAKHILTAEETTLLRAVLIPTYLPGSKSLQEIVSKSQIDQQLKDQYIIKAIRGVGSRDIYYGANLSQEEWLTFVEPLASAAVAVSEQKYIVQDALDQMEYDIVRTRVSEEVEKFCLVGTFHTINGRFIGVGLWRIARNRQVISLIGGENICMTTIIDDEPMAGGGRE